MLPRLRQMSIAVKGSKVHSCLLAIVRNWSLFQFLVHLQILERVCWGSILCVGCYSGHSRIQDRASSADP